MFVVFESGGKQYKVSEGERVAVENLNFDIGHVLQIPVKMLGGCPERGTVLGSPDVPGTFVDMKVIAHEKDQKLIVFKFRRRKSSRRKNGHRRKLTILEMVSINSMNVLVA